MFIITTTASDNKQKKEWEGDWLEDVCEGVNGTMKVTMAMLRESVYEEAPILIYCPRST